MRKLPAEALNPYRDMMLGDVVNGPRGKIAHEWAARQAYIALGNLMTGAAVLGVDACPMEGLVPAEYDKILNLERHRLCNGRGLRARLSRRRATNTPASPKFATKRRIWCACCDE